ncbi:MAG: LysR family transcriptional regulator [Pseudomonadota bacterium]|nr:LysR family transcriptional regulator [Pseudomonadota bacterium]
MPLLLDLNFHHLRLFWAVVKEGGVARAGKRLGLSQPTISGQLRTLADQLGTPLFSRSGRSLQLTDTGRVVFRYADEIFSLGRELQAVVAGGGADHPLVTVGVSDAVPKMLTHRLLEPVLKLPQRPRLIVIEDRTDRLLAELAVHRLDVVLADTPMLPTHKVKAWHHRLGEAPVVCCAVPDLAARLRLDFPRSLEGAPLLLPTEQAAVRHALDLWLEELHIRPDVVAELDDSALIKTFGASGAGAFFVNEAVVTDVERQYGVERVGTVESVRERYFAISVERRVRNPAVVALMAAAGSVLRQA